MRARPEVQTLKLCIEKLMSYFLVYSMMELYCENAIADNNIKDNFLLQWIAAFQASTECFTTSPRVARALSSVAPHIRLTDTYFEHHLGHTGAVILVHP